MAELYRLRGCTADIVNDEGDVVPVDVRELDARYGIDTCPDVESIAVPQREKPVVSEHARATGAVALGAYFCGDCLRHVGPGGCGHMRGYRGKGSRGTSRSHKARSGS